MLNWYPIITLLWRHNGHDGVSNHRRFDCLFNRRSQETSKLRVTGLCAGNSPVTGEFPAQMAINAENVPIWWRHHENMQVIATHLKTNLLRVINISSWCHDIFCTTGPLWGESTGDHWFPSQRASNEERWCFPWCQPVSNSCWTNIRSSMICDDPVIFRLSILKWVTVMTTFPL